MNSAKFRFLSGRNFPSESHSSAPLLAVPSRDREPRPPHPVATMATASAAAASHVPVNLSRSHAYPWWSPRFWSGMRGKDWGRLLKDNQFRIRPNKIPWVIFNSLRSPGNGGLAFLQHLFLSRDIERTPIKRPIFVIGHWRSGTTLMHELLVQNKGLAAPCNYHVFAPHHFLITEWLANHFFSRMLPRNRPMDDVQVDWETPQEDEFFHLAMGRGTPYLRLAFPHQPNAGLDYVDMEGLDEHALQDWKRIQTWFMRCVAFRYRKDLVLKSPAHTGRIHVLSEMFPDARFVHITREPYGMFASTVRMWRCLDQCQALQDPTGAPVEDFVLQAGRRMYASFHRHRHRIPANQICDIRYEDLVANPLDTLAQVYQDLRLGDFEPQRPAVASFLHDRREFSPNRHSLPSVWKAKVAETWGDYVERYGYGEPVPARKRA